MKLVIENEKTNFDKEAVARAEAKREKRKARNKKWLKAGMVTCSWKPSTVTKTERTKPWKWEEKLSSVKE